MAAQFRSHSKSADSRRKVVGKQAATNFEGGEAESAAVMLLAASPVTPCGACKFLRRKCISGCIFAPYFSSDQGSARFAAVHKVFGASNVSKLLLHIPVSRRHDAVVTISYEAQARLSDPVYGCVSSILALQQQVAALRAELAMVQTQLINSRFALATAVQSSHAQQQQNNIEEMINNVELPAYSNNNSCASTNLINNLAAFTSPPFDLPAEDHTTPLSSHSCLDPLQLSQPNTYEDQEDDEEEIRFPTLHFNL